MAQYKTFNTMAGTEKKVDQKVLNGVLKISSDQERNNLIKNNKVLVIDNYADWCGPCKTIAPVYAELCQKYSKPGICMLVKEDIDQEFNEKEEQVTGVPTFHFYINGSLRKDLTLVGGDKDKLISTMESLFNNQQPGNHPHGNHPSQHQPGNHPHGHHQPGNHPHGHHPSQHQPGHHPSQYQPQNGRFQTPPPRQPYPPKYQTRR